MLLLLLVVINLGSMVATEALVLQVAEVMDVLALVLVVRL